MLNAAISQQNLCSAKCCSGLQNYYTPYPIGVVVCDPTSPVRAGASLPK